MNKAQWQEVIDCDSWIGGDHIHLQQKLNISRKDLGTAKYRVCLTKALEMSRLFREVSQLLAGYQVIEGGKENKS